MGIEIILLVVLAALLVFMFWRSSQQRKKRAAEIETRMVPGAEVMTNAGIFAKIVSVNQEESKVVLEIAPGVNITVIQQAVTRFVDPTPAPEDETTTVDHETTTVDHETTTVDAESHDTMVADSTTETRPPRGLFGRARRDADQ